MAEEIHALRSQGMDVRIISLLRPRAGPVQPRSQALLPHTWYAPGLLTPALWWAQLVFLLASPRRYLSLLATLLRQPYPRQPLALLAKRAAIFLKAVAMAHHLRGSGAGAAPLLLHAHFAWLPGAAAWVSARLLDRPFTVTVHAYDLYSWKNDLLRLTCSQADHVVAISEYNRQRVVETGACPPEAVSVIHCGVDLPPPREQPPARAEGVAGPLRILSVGSLTPKKGHTHLIAACRLLQQRGLDFTCAIIGGGPGEAALRRQVQAHGLQDRVQLLGARPYPEIAAAYRQHDLFVLASVVAPDGDRDGIPVALMEAGAWGLPLVSTRVSGIPELVRHGQTGWLTPPGDAAALAEAISAAAADPTLRARLGRNARAFVETEFDIEKNARRLADLFRRIGDSKPSGHPHHLGRGPVAPRTP